MTHISLFLQFFYSPDGDNAERKCDIEFYYPGKNKKKLKFTLTNFMRKGVTTKEKVVDFIMWEDHEELKQQIIDEMFCYYS